MEQYSKEVNKLLSRAEKLAFTFNHGFVTSEHVLLSILKEKEQPLTKELNKVKIDYELIAKKVKSLFPKKEKEPLCLEYSIELKLLLSKAKLLLQDKKDAQINSAILSYVLITEENSGSYILLKRLKVDFELLKDNLFIVKKSSDLDNIQDLHRLGIKKKDPLIGREKELKQLINSLSRRNKPNAILVGEPGVGKTAIVEELAFLLENDKIPYLKGKKIYELDIASTVGGTKYRGEFEEKIKKIIKKVIEDGTSIIFIDEIHNIIHAGGAEGAIDASNILKPYLSRGEIQIIGATTSDEYESIFEKDKPLKRRFQKIQVYQTSPQETKDILYKLKPIYEEYYNTSIPNVILDEIVHLASLYLPEYSFPDKAIDILDNALVNVKDNKITIQDVINTMSLFYKIQSTNKEDIDRLYLILKSNIIGQSEALKKINDILLSLSLDLKNESGPLLSLLFVGPSGVGKSRTAKLIGEYLFSDENTYILNMSLYQDYYSLKELLSSFKGVYGEESSPFIKTIKNHPHLCLIIEDIDKAHNDVINFFKSILDKGGFYDLKGKYIDMHNVLIIMTTNFGYQKEDRFSFNMKREKINKNILDKLSSRFEIDFISRIDEIITFSYLNKESLYKITESLLINSKENINLINSSLIDNIDYEKNGVFLLKQNIKKELIKNKEKKILN